MNKKIMWFILMTLTPLAYLNLAITIPNYWVGTVKEMNTLKVDSFYYNQHTMLMFEKDANFSICHSPTCKKCYQIFD